MSETTWNDRSAALGSALFGVISLSLGAIFVRLADVEPLRSAFLRVAYAAPVLFAIDRLRVRTSARGHVPVGRAVPVGAVLGADLVLLHQTISILGAGLAVVLANLQVVFVGIGAIWVFDEIEVCRT